MLLSALHLHTNPLLRRTFDRSEARENIKDLLSRHLTHKRTLIWVLICLCLWAPRAQASEVRVFTNKDGKTIEAELISIHDGKAEIRRSGDGQVFKIDVVNLSLDDQNWIFSQAKRQFGDWKLLRVSLPNPTDTASVIGMGSNSGLNSEDATRVGGTEFEFLIPLGAWVRLSIYGSDKKGEYFKQLVRYDGAERWEVTCKSRAVWLSRDGSSPEICGVSLPRGSEAAPAPDDVIGEFAKGFKPADFSESISLQIADDVDPTSITSLGWPIDAIVFDNSVNRDFLTSLNELQIEAASLRNGEDVLKALEDFSSLKALEISNGHFRTDGNSRTSVFEDRNFRLPQIRDLSLYGFRSSSELRRSLAGIEGLRLLRQFSPGAAAAVNNLPPDSDGEWTEVDRFKGLESLEVSDAVRFSALEIASLPKLRRLVIHESNFSNDDPRLSSLFGIRSLLQLSINTVKFRNDFIDQWARSGNLADLRVFEGYRSSGFEMMPKLLRLSISRGEDAANSISSATFTALTELRRLTVSGANPAELNAIASLSERNKLEAIRLTGGTFDNLEGLKELKGLRSLEVRDLDAPLRALDLSWFPGLEFLDLRRVSNIREIHNLSAHSSLLGFDVYFCTELASLGDPQENTTLRTFRLADCPAIASIAGLSKTTGLTSFSIFRCEILSEPLGIDLLNPDACIVIVECPLLPERRPL